MAEFVLRSGSCSVQGVRSNNEDRFVVDLNQRLFIVADGMGGQEKGELASGMAVEIIPQVVQNRLAAREPAAQALRQALTEANDAIIDAGASQPEGRHMGTTAVCALQLNDQVYVTGLGDSRAYLIRGKQVEQLTVDHSVAQALVSTGALTAEEARHSPYPHVLHKFLGCTTLGGEGAEIRPFTPQAGDWLLLGSDGLTNHINESDLIEGPTKYADPQRWAEYLVRTALDRGSRDNVTVVVVAFDREA